MTLSSVFLTHSEVPKRFSFFERPLMVRTFKGEILQIFLDKMGFLFGVLSGREEGNLEKKYTFLPLQPIFPEQIETLRRLLSPNMSFLRLKTPHVIEIEPKLLGGGGETEVNPEIKIARELFLKLNRLRDISELKLEEIFDKISDLAEILPSLIEYEDHLAGACYIAKVLHIAIDVLLIAIWTKGRYENENTRYSSQQKRSILDPIRNAKEILRGNTFTLKEITSLSLDLFEVGAHLLPESDMKPEDSKRFIGIGKTLNLSSPLPHSFETDLSQQLSKLLGEVWSSLGGHWTVSLDLYRDSILARFLSLNKNFQETKITHYLNYLPLDETFLNIESEEESDSISRSLLAFDRLTDLSLYEPKEELKEQAFRLICPWIKSRNELLRKTAILLLTQISLLSRDTFIKREAFKSLNKIGLDPEKDNFLPSYQKWVVDNLPQGYLDEDNLEIEHSFEKARDKKSLDIIKRLICCAPEEPIPPFFLEDEFVPYKSTLQKITDLGLIEESRGVYKVSKKTQNRLKKLISKEARRDEKALLGLARSLSKEWNFDEKNLSTYRDQQENTQLHVQSFVENVPKDTKTSPSLLIASIAFLNKLGLYHLFIKKDLGKGIGAFKEALDRLDLIHLQTEKEASPGFILPKREEIQSFFNICLKLEQTGSKVDILAQELNTRGIRFLGTLIRTFPNISSLELKGLNGGIRALALEIVDSRVVHLCLESSQIVDEGAKALAALLSSHNLTSLNLQCNQIGDEGIKAIATALPQSKLTHLNLRCNKIRDEGIHALAATIPLSQLNNLNLADNWIGDEGARALAAVLPSFPLTNLDLRDNQIHLLGVNALAGSLPFSKLTHLNLKSNFIKDLHSRGTKFQSIEEVKALAASLTSSCLTTLDLQSNRIDTVGAKALAEALPKSQLTTLYLQGNQIGDEGARLLAEALPFSKLTHLHLQGNQIGDLGAKALAGSLPTSKVAQLDLSNFSSISMLRNETPRIGNVGAKALAAALSKSRLTHLHLQGNRIGAEGAKALAIALPSSLVTTLELNYNEIGDEGAKALARTLPLYQFTTLDLRSNKIGDEGVKALATSLPSSILTSLILIENQISDEGVVALAASLPCSKITSISLENNRIGDEGIIALAASVSNSRITTLNLNGNRIGDRGAIALAALLPSSKLTDLRLHKNEIGAEGAVALAAALPFSKVTDLCLHKNKIGAEGAKALAKGLSSSGLTTLGLYHNQIGDEGVIALALALPSSRLTQLCLNSNQISDKGAITLARTLPFSKLIKLHLEGNQITSEGTKALAATLPSSRLTSLYLGHNQIGGEGASALAASLPYSHLTHLNFPMNTLSNQQLKTVKEALKNRYGAKIQIVETTFWS